MKIPSPVKVPVLNSHQPPTTNQQNFKNKTMEKNEGSPSSSAATSWEETPKAVDARRGARS
jgi:hypothetical protein